MALEIKYKQPCYSIWSMTTGWSDGPDGGGSLVFQSDTTESSYIPKSNQLISSSLSQWEESSLNEASIHKANAKAGSKSREESENKKFAKWTSL